MEDEEQTDRGTGRQEGSKDTSPTIFIEREEVVVPDGGWGWFIVFGSFLCHFIIGGMERSAGLLYLYFIERFRQSAATTAWTTTLASALRLMLGPLCSFLCNKFSCRHVVIVGSLIVTVTLIMTAYAPNLETVFVTFGVLGGFGRSLAYAPAVMMVGIYFNKKRGIAVGLGTSGVGFGSFAAPAIVEMAFHFYGYSGGFYILACFAINLCIAGMLFRPLEKQRLLMAYDKRRKSMKTFDVEFPLKESDSFISRDSLNQLPTESVPAVNPMDGGYLDVDSMTLVVQDTKSAEVAEKELSLLKTQEDSVSGQNGSMKNAESYKEHKSCCGFFRSKSKPGQPRNNFLELSLLKDFRFLSFCVAILLFTLAFQSAFVFLPAYGKQLGNTDMESAYLIIITGAFDGVGRVISGVVLDLKKVKRFRVYIYNIIMFLVGGVSFVIPMTGTYTQLCVVCGLYGLLIGIYISQKSVILVDLLGAEKLINSFGLLICFQGVGMLIGPPFSGFLKDINGQYENAFYVGGSSMFLGALILLTSNIRHLMLTRKGQCNEKEH